MTLKNLLKTGQLVEFDADPDEIARMLRAAQRSIRDATVIEISPETRFDAAWRGIMQAATAALWANGYRTSSSSPGHHRITVQALTKSIGLDRDRIAVLDRLRHKRNVADYSGEDIDQSSVTVCVGAAVQLLDDVHEWIIENRPDLVDE